MGYMLFLYKIRKLGEEATFNSLYGIHNNENENEEDENNFQFPLWDTQKMIFVFLFLLV